MPQSQFNNADAVVLDQNQPNWLQGFVAGRNAGQPNYKLLSYDLQRQRLAEQEQRQQATDYQKAYNQLWNLDKTMKPGAFGEQIRGIADDYLRQLQEKELAGDKDPQLVKQMSAHLLSLMQKQQSVEDKINTLDKQAKSDKNINYGAWTGLVHNFFTGKNGKPKDIDDVDPDNINIQSFRNTPGYADLYNSGNLMKSLLNDYGVTKINESITSGNALSSAQQKTAATFSNAFDKDPATGEYIPRSTPVNLDPEAYDFATQEIGDTGKSTRGVSDDIYNHAKAIPDVSEWMNAKINDYNKKNGLTPKDENYIDPYSPEGVNVKKVLLYHYMGLKGSTTKSTSTTNRTTMPYWALHYPTQYARYQAAKGQLGNEANLVANTSAAFSGDPSQLQAVGKEITPPAGLQQITGNNYGGFYDVTDTYKSITAYKDAKGKRHPYYRVLGKAGEPGVIWVQKTEDSDPEQVNNPGQFLMDLAHHNPSSVVNSEKVATILGMNVKAPEPQKTIAEPKQNIIQKAAKKFKDKFSKRYKNDPTESRR